MRERLVDDSKEGKKKRVINTDGINLKGTGLFSKKGEVMV